MLLKMQLGLEVDDLEINQVRGNIVQQMLRL